MILFILGVNLLIVIPVISLCFIQRINKLNTRLKELGRQLKASFRHSDFLTAKMFAYSDENEILRKRIAELENTAKANNKIVENTAEVITVKCERLINTHFEYYNHSEAELNKLFLEDFKLSLPNNLIEYKAEKKNNGLLISCKIRIVQPFII